MNLLLKAKNIVVEHADKILLNIDALEIYDYDRIGLIGANGSGKTTLLKLLAGKITREGCCIQTFGNISLIEQLDEFTNASAIEPSLLSQLHLSAISGFTMSGGESTRLKIASAFSTDAHAVFADEPTSHLDREGITFLINQLRAFDGALLIISHDRDFLDQTVDKIWELTDGKITEYWGNYSTYKAEKDKARRQEILQYKQVMDEKAALKKAAEGIKKQAAELNKKKKGKKAQDHNQAGGRLAHQKSVGSKQQKLYKKSKQLEQRLADLDTVKKPEQQMTFYFRQSEILSLHNKFPITGEDFNFAYNEKIIFDRADFVIPLGAKVAITGTNGSGKTTLLKAIMNRAPGLTISPKAVFGYFEQTNIHLHSTRSVFDYLAEASDYKTHELRAGLAAMGFGTAAIKKPLKVLSGGETIKLKLLHLLYGRYNILLLDEPGNYLDLQALEALEAMITHYAGTVLLISHDKQLTQRTADLTLKIEQGKIKKL